MSVIPSRITQGLIVDLFAGGGGASIGIEAAMGRHVDIAINHDPVAIAVHKRNHPLTVHYTTDIWDVRPKKATCGQPVLLLHASPDCKDFSRAKGGKPKSGKIRSLAWVVHRWAVDVRPSVITLENVPEFVEWCPLDDDNKRIDKRKGETFKRWKRGLEKLGYVVEHRILTASHYGAPTSRKRLFLIARCDGQPVVWPKATHGPGLLPFHTAAEIIDWSIFNPSIFERKKPLADKTLRRIAAGIVRYALETATPFIVKVNHGGEGRRPESINDPLSTVTAARRGHALVVPSLIQTSYGERKGQAPRVLDLQKPLGTVVAQGQKHALVCAFLAKHYGGVVGQPLDKTIGTITAVDHHSLVTASLEPGDHSHEIRAFLTTYYGNVGDTGQSLNDPLRTVVTKDRFGLVTVKLPNGESRAISDITLRMLAPHELAGGQLGRFAAAYDMSDAKTTKDKVRLVGNSVCPEVEEAIVAAQFPQLQRRRAA